MRKRTRLETEVDDHRDMVGGLVPASAVTVDAGGGERADQRRCDPNMVEPAAAVGGGPVAGAVAPPGIEALFGGHEMAHRVDKAAGLLQRAESGDFDPPVA